MIHLHNIYKSLQQVPVPTFRLWQFEQFVDSRCSVVQDASCVPGQHFPKENMNLLFQVAIGLTQFLYRVPSCLDG